MGDRVAPRSVLVTRFSALGDVAMTLPVVYGACMANPEIKFTMLTRRLPASMFLHCPPNLAVEAVDLENYKGISGLNRLLGEMRERHGVDAVADLHDVLRTKVLRLLAAARGLRVASVRKGRAAKKALTRHRSKQLAKLPHMTERYRETFHDLGLSVASGFKGLFPSGKADPQLFASVTAPRREGDIWIAVAPFAAHKGKVYPLPLMKKTVNLLLTHPDRKIFIFGSGDGERKKIEEIAAGRPQVVNMAAEKAGMTAELALMTHCSVMLAMDSANMHLASLAGLRTLSIWGATHPWAGFYGTGQNPGDALQADLPCRPCSVFGNKECRRGDWACLNSIKPETVASRIEMALGHSSANPDNITTDQNV